MMKKTIMIVAALIFALLLSLPINLKLSKDVVYVPNGVRYSAVPVKDLPLCLIAWRIVRGGKMPTLGEIYPQGCAR